MAGEIIVRSWTRVYKPERRIYSIPNGRGQWVIPVTGGIPLWGALYFLGGVLLVYVLRHMPVIGLVFGIVPSELMYGFVPIGLAYVGARWRPDGRMPHRALLSWATTRMEGRRFQGEEGLPTDLAAVIDEEVTLAPGPEWPYLIDADVAGPALVATRRPVEVQERRKGLAITGPAGHGGTTHLRVRAGETLRVRPRRRADDGAC